MNTRRKWTQGEKSVFENIPESRGNKRKKVKAKQNVPIQLLWKKLEGNIWLKLKFKCLKQNMTAFKRNRVLFLPIKQIFKNNLKTIINIITFISSLWFIHLFVHRILSLWKQHTGNIIKAQFVIFPVTFLLLSPVATSFLKLATAFPWYFIFSVYILQDVFFSLY